MTTRDDYQPPSQQTEGPPAPSTEEAPQGDDLLEPLDLDLFGQWPAFGDTYGAGPSTAPSDLPPPTRRLAPVGLPGLGELDANAPSDEKHLREQALDQRAASLRQSGQMNPPTPARRQLEPTILISG